MKKGYEEIFNRLEGADGAISILKQTADEISAQVRKGTERIAELTIRADGIPQRVQDNEQGIAELEITAAGWLRRKLPALPADKRPDRRTEKCVAV